MLGARTKQVNTYGKRASRIVDASGNRDWSKETPIVLDNLPPAQWAPVAMKARKRDDTAPSGSKEPEPSHSPKIVRVQKKKKTTIVSPSRQRSRVSHKADGGLVVSTEASPVRLKAENISKKRESKGKEPITPVRIPLSSFSPNVPSSPASRKPRKPWSPAIKRTSSGLKPLQSSTINVDIIILDDDGKEVSQVHRKSKMNVEVNPVRELSQRSKFTNRPSSSIVISDSDDDVKPIPRRLEGKQHRQRVILSDTESDLDTSPIPQTTLNTSGSRDSRLNSSVEVMIPPPPYRIPKHQHQTQPARLDRGSRSRSSTPPPQHAPFIDTHSTRIPSPLIKPRQLTPIRGSRRKQLFEPPSPPSPSTPTDFDLSLDFSQLDVGPSSQFRSSTHVQPDYPEYLRPLLEECHQDDCGPYEFSAFIESFPFDPVVAMEPDADVEFRKIGEASYSEVFGIGDVVLKIIPLRDETKDEKSRSRFSADEVEGPAPTDARDVQKEIIVTRAMGGVCDGFVKLLKTYVVRGKYPDLLLNLWDEFNEKKGSESIRPDTFTASQVYAIIVLPNGGPDLEAYTFSNASKTGWRQACSLFWQVAKSLAHAEQLVSFEHRDLHWGQILVKNLSTSTSSPLKKSKSRKRYMDDPMHGIQVTLIDLGLARMDAGDGTGGEHIHWTPFEEEVFMGEGDYQFDVYRLMRDYIGDGWEGFNPLTNVMWLHYLAIKLLLSKRLKVPSLSRNGTSKGTLHTSSTSLSPLEFTEKECYDCLIEMERWLGECVVRVAQAYKRNKGGKRKTQTVLGLIEPSCAGDVVEYAARKRWVKPIA
ncbi:hypothetical protein AX16_000990 [Volvariella volvacea WC 439]|nr:hypothetical protein AX16_000990 [Volvariella volvacea WC 439]